MKPASILITDDESNIRMMLRSVLESEGYAVREAADGREALEALRQTPELLLLDLNMPVLDGMAVLEHLKALPDAEAMRVIVLTAYGSIATAVRATRLGAVDFLEKPITPMELREAVHSVLAHPELDAPPAAVVNIQADYEEALSRIRSALRVTDHCTPEALLEKASQQKSQHPAEYFNLLGVLYETNQRWRLARKCYAKAVAADKRFEPAQANLRRLHELHAYGRSHEAVALGDKGHEIWFAQSPQNETRGSL